MVLTCLAVALGVYSWWNRYESAHRATQFWGPEAAEVLVEPGKVEVASLGSRGEEGDGTANMTAGQSLGPWRDISEVSGMVHLRHALTTDSNYRWDQESLAADIWKWAFRFSRGDREVWVLFTADFATVGNYDRSSSTARAVSCRPMAATLQDYFATLDLPVDAATAGASKAQE